MRLRFVAVLCGAAFASAFAACSSSDDGSGATSTSDGGGGPDVASIPDARQGDATSTDAATVDAGPPPMPALATKQLDRAGRALVSLALATPVGLAPISAQTGTRSDAQLVAEDDYNAAADPSTYASFAPVFVSNLKVWDGLDGTCGNTFMASATPATRYDALASMFVDDRLYLDTAKGTCTSYLALERNHAGATIDDCGGRAPGVDAIDTTLTAIVQGFGGGTFGDGVPAATDATPSASTFPFLATPN